MLTLTFELVVPYRIDLPLVQFFRQLAFSTRRLDRVRVKVNVQPSKIAIADERVFCQVSVGKERIAPLNLHVFPNNCGHWRS